MNSRASWTVGVSFLGLAIAFAPAGCDDDGALDTSGMGGTGGSGGTVMTGVDGNKRLDMLTPAEQTKLCESSAEFLSTTLASTEVQMSLCKLGAVLAGGFGGADAADMCEISLQQCLGGLQGAPAALPDGGAGEACQSTGMPPNMETCQVTVAQYEACVNGLPSGFRNLGSAVPSCASLSADAGVAASPLFLLAAFPPTCLLLAQQCGGLGALPIGIGAGM